MALHGADVAQLREAAGRLGQSAEQLAHVRSVLAAAIAQTTWHGPDAEQFRGEWEGTHSRTLLAAANRLQEAAATLQRNAVAQESTSAAGGGSTGGGAGPVLQTLPDRIEIGDDRFVLPDETGGLFRDPDIPRVEALPDRIEIGDDRFVLPDETGGLFRDPDIPRVEALPGRIEIGDDGFVLPDETGGFIGNLPQGEAWRGGDQ